MSPPVSPTLRAAIDAVTLAGVLCRRVQRALTGAQTASKADGSVVTVADYAAQALIVRSLHERLDLDAIVAEETAGALRADGDLLRDVVAVLRDDHGAPAAWPGATTNDVLDALSLRAWDHAGPVPEAYWTIDPIDGTKGFAAQRHFAVCLARIERARPVLSAVACPNLGATRATSEPIDTHAHDARGSVYACEAAGPVWEGACEAQGQALRALAPRAEVTRAPVLAFAVEPSEGRMLNLQRLSHELARDAGAHPHGLGAPIAMDSQAKYCLVARGSADVYHRPPRRNHEHIWDHAAGCLLLERAGCTVTDVRGAPIDWSGPSMRASVGILGAPPGLHARLLPAIARVDAQIAREQRA